MALASALTCPERETDKRMRLEHEQRNFCVFAD